MADVDFLYRADPNDHLPALALKDATQSRAALAGSVQQDMDWLTSLNVGLGTPVVVLGDFCFASVSLLLALIALDAIVVPLTPATHATVSDILDDVQPEVLITVDPQGDCETHKVERRPARPPSPMYRTLIERQKPGLVLFTSGSTGRPKIVVHDLSKLLDKFRSPRPGFITLNFLLFDHWGGLNTLFGCLASRALVVFPTDRSPWEIGSLVARHRIELLPTTPTFLNRLLIGRIRDKLDLSSLKLITYGAEPMAASTLTELRRQFPTVELRQTYGMIELGVMRAKSRSSDSLWVKLGGEGFELRVVDGLLQVKADSAMLGYLNAPSPFTEDGFLMTGDMVEQDGEYLRVLGRKSDIINVGGQKVYPAEVESVLLEVPGVADAVVYGQKHVLTGQIVCADILPDGAVDDPAVMRKRIRQGCSAKLQPYAVPVRINFSDVSFYTVREKKRRDL